MVLNDPTLEGFFDLAGLVNASSSGSAKFQLSVESVDPIWSAGIQKPYGSSWPVDPAGNTRVFRLETPAWGKTCSRTSLMLGSVNSTAELVLDATKLCEVPVDPATPASGDWMGSISPYGDVDYFSLTAQANRTLSISATALGELGAASEQEAQPVIGIWSLAAPQTDSATKSARLR